MDYNLLQSQKSWKRGRYLYVLLVQSCLLLSLPLASHATRITITENWERLQFKPGQSFRIYSPREFSQAIPGWSVNTSARNGYGVEHQHSRITWGQRGSNDDFLELDRQFIAAEPQIFTGFSTVANQALESLSVHFQAAARPDLDRRRTLALYGRNNGGDWRRLDTFSIFGSTAAYPRFTPFMYTLNFNSLFSGLFEFGFGCTDCGQRAGYGPLLGNVTARYEVRAVNGRGGEPVPEPSSLVLLATAALGFARRRQSLH